MKITLVTSPIFDHASYYTGSRPRAQVYLPLGLLALGASLQKSDIEVVIADLNRAYNEGPWKKGKYFYQSGADFLKFFGSDIIGFMTASDSYHHTLGIASCFHAQNPDVPIILGGYQATAAVAATLAHFPFVKAIVRGEGEQVTPQLIKALCLNEDLNEIAGITYRKGNEIITNPDQQLIEDLDEIPIPAYQLVPYPSTEYLYLEIGRGCPYGCTFCSTAPYWRRKARNKSVRRVIEEIKFLKERYSIEKFNFVHDLFTSDNNWVFNFCKQIRAENIHWTCSARLDTVSKNLLETMAGAGCKEIYYGVETNSTEIQKNIRKNFADGLAETIVRQTIESGISPNLGYIAGFPWETIETFRGSLKAFFKFKDMGVSRVHFFVATPETGSEMYRLHANNLEFTGHFLDFPVTKELAAETHILARKHPEIFSALHRFKSEKCPKTLFYGIDEFSPLVNTVPLPISLAVRQLKDPLEFYELWLDWLSERKEKERARRYYGTIEDMFEFLSALQSLGKIKIKYLADLLKYERIKNGYRRNFQTIGKELKKIKFLKKSGRIGDFLPCKPVQSMFNKTGVFKYDLKTLYEKGAEGTDGILPESVNILFFVALKSMEPSADFTQDSEVAIGTLKIDDLSKIILDLCNGKNTLESIVALISNFYLHEMKGTENGISELILKKIMQLYKLGVLNFVA